MDILPQLLVNSLIAGSIYALATSGLSLTYGLLRILNFAHGHLLMVGAYMFYFASTILEGEVISAAIFTFASVVILAGVSLRIFVVPFTRYSSLLPFVTTLALSIILESAISLFFGVNVKSISLGLSMSSYEIAGIYITPVQIIIISSAILLLAALAFLIHSTSLGRKIRALSEFTPGAESIGINSRTFSYSVFMLATVLAAYAGVLIGCETNLQPTMGSVYTIKAFAAMILGGLGNIWGAIAGSYILGLVENLSIGLDFWGYSLPAGYKDAFAFVIILLILLFKPEGLFNTRTRRA